MRKSIALLLTVLMTLAFALPVFAQANVNSGDQTAHTADYTRPRPGKPTAQDDDLTVYGYIMEMGEGYLDYGFGEYYVGADTKLIYTGVDDEELFGAAYVKDPHGDDAIYAVFEREYITDEVLVRYDGIDAWKAGEYTEVGHAPERIFSVSMDYTTNVLYALSETGTIYVIDTQNGAFLKTVTLNLGATTPPVSMTIDNKGDMYVLCFGGNLHRVDPLTGESTLVGNSGHDVTLTQTIMYDYNTDSLYWFWVGANGADGSYGTLVVNRDDASATLIGKNADCLIRAAFTVPESITYPTAVEPTGVELKTESKIEVIAMDTYVMSAFVQPMDKYVADRNIKWSVKDADIAAIDDTGFLTALKPGTTTVTASTQDGKFKAECTLTVKDPETVEEYVELSGAINSDNVKENDKNYILFKTDLNNYPWTVVDDVNRGKVARSGNIQIDNCVSYVENIYPLYLPGGSTLTFDYSISSSVTDMDSFYLYVNGEMYLANDLQHQGAVGWSTCTWTAPRSGYYTFRWEYDKDWYLYDGQDCAWLDNVSYTLAEEKPLESIKINPETADVFTGKTLQLNIDLVPENAAMVDVTYKSSDPSVATVSDTGLVTALKGGKTTITATTDDGKFTATSTINVLSVYKIETLPYTEEMPLNDTFTATLTDYINIGGRIKFAKGYKLILGDGTGVNINLNYLHTESDVEDTMIYVYDTDFNQLALNDDKSNASPLSQLDFVPEEAGTYYVIITTLMDYTEDGGSTSVTTTTFDTIKVTGLDVAPKSATLQVGSIAQINALLTPIVNDYPNITYESSDRSVASVTNSGLLSAVAPGTAVITVTASGGLKAESTITVTADKVPAPEYNGKIYGFAASDSLYFGFAEYDPQKSARELKSVSITDQDIYSAVYHDGMVYAYSYEYVSAIDAHRIRFVTFDAQTFTEQSSRIVGSLYPNDMTYDYTTDTVYASVTDPVTGINSFAKVNLNGGAISVVREFRFAEEGIQMMTIEATTDGSLYGVASDGYLYEIDKNTGFVQQLYDMALQTTYINTMVFDHYTQKMYWFPYNDDGSQVVCFNPETGDIENTEDFGETATEFIGAMIFANPDTFPKVEPTTTYKVTFMDFEGKVAAEVTVKEGRDAIAPTVKHPDGIPFAMWDKDITNVHEDMTVNPISLADVNMDNQVNAADATLILRASVEAIKLDETQTMLADANGSDTVESADATVVLRYSVMGTWPMGK